MQPQNIFLSYLIEGVKRIFVKKPKWFVYAQYLVGFLGAVTGLPGLLAQWKINLPPALTLFENKFVAACAIGFVIASQLTSATPVATVTADGKVLTKTDASQLPFTAQHEIKSAQDARVPNSSSTLEQMKR